MDALATDLLHWYDEHARVLPWRSYPSPYRTWLSEVMLQQTQVDTVLPYYERFLEAYPTVEDLAAASLDEVLSLWSGLGYYSRARNMHKTANQVASEGSFPLDIKGLRQLSGVGEYMAGAIGSIALGLDVATVDGNIARVMARVHADAGSRKNMWAHAERHLPEGRAGDYNQALMDLGARICRPRSAKCELCPIGAHCQAFEEGRVDEFPPPKKKREVPEVSMLAQLFEREGRVLLARRRDSGLWGGLWELPAIEHPGATPDESAAAAAWMSAFVVPLKQGALVFERRHVLSHRVYHYRLTVGLGPEPSELGPYTEFSWMDAEGLCRVGLSALTARALTAAGLKSD